MFGKKARKLILESMKEELNKCYNDVCALRNDMEFMEKGLQIIVCNEELDEETFQSDVADARKLDVRIRGVQGKLKLQSRTIEQERKRLEQIFVVKMADKMRKTHHMPSEESVNRAAEIGSLICGLSFGGLKAVTVYAGHIVVSYVTKTAEFKEEYKGCKGILKNLHSTVDDLSTRSKINLARLTDKGTVMRFHVDGFEEPEVPEEDDELSDGGSEKPEPEEEFDELYQLEEELDNYRERAENLEATVQKLLDERNLFTSQIEFFKSQLAAMKQLQDSLPESIDEEDFEHNNSKMQNLPRNLVIILVGCAATAAIFAAFKRKI